MRCFQAQAWGQSAWVHIPALPLTGSVTLGKSASLCLSFLSHEMGQTIAPASGRRCEEDMMEQVRSIYNVPGAQCALFKSRSALLHVYFPKVDVFSFSLSPGCRSERYSSFFVHVCQRVPRGQGTHAGVHCWAVGCALLSGSGLGERAPGEGVLSLTLA